MTLNRLRKSLIVGRKTNETNKIMQWGFAQKTSGYRQIVVIGNCNRFLPVITLEIVC